MTRQAELGQRVRRLRVGLGLGQVELAERLGVASGTVSMLENGRLPVDQPLLDSLAGVLDCSPVYFTVTDPEPLATRPWLRAYADASKKAVDRTVADSVTAIDAAHRVGLAMMPDALPAFDGDLNDDDAIEAFASEVRGLAGLSSDDVVGNAIRSAERLGCIVLPMDNELGRHLGISLRVDGVPVIRASRPSEDAERHIPGDRQRFTVAHEIGHLSLHPGSPPPDSAADAARIEKQAHRFAAAFLAPGDAVLSDLDRLGGRVTLTTLQALKATWGVSIKALVMRLQQLGVVDDDQARSLYKQISARRWNKVEPVPVGHESAVWLKKAITRWGKDSADPASAVGRAAGLGPAYLARWTDWSPTPSERPEASVHRLRPRAAPGGDLPGDGAQVSHLPVRGS